MVYYKKKNCDKDLCATETRVVKCSDSNSICDPLKRPVSVKKCDLPTYLQCGKWSAEAWSNVGVVLKHFESILFIIK